MKGRPGFSLVELTIALVFVGILSVAVTGTFMSQTRVLRQQEQVADAQATSTAAVNVVASELRMVEAAGGVVAASSDSVMLRVPYVYGVTCTSDAASTVADLFPVDSAVYAGVGYGGYGWSNGAGYSYVSSSTSPATASASTCTNAQVDLVPGGRTVTLTPGAGAVPAGTPLYLYRVISYRFRPSSSLPGRIGLWRRTAQPDSSEELAAPFDSTAHFRYFTGGTTAQEAPVADLTTINGVELLLTGATTQARGAGGAYLTVPVTAAVFFANRN